MTALLDVQLDPQEKSQRYAVAWYPLGHAWQLVNEPPQSGVQVTELLDVQLDPQEKSQRRPDT